MKSTWARKLTLMLALLAIAVVLTSTAFAAETIVEYETRQFNDSGNNTHFFQRLDDSGSTSVFFNTSLDKKPIKITYNAECGVLGQAGSWVSVTILVDGNEANPRVGTDFAFCSATSQQIYTRMGVVRQSFLVVPFAGRHRVQVRVDLVNGANTWWLGNTSIIIEGK